jgi:hypothetical protein
MGFVRTAMKAGIAKKLWTEAQKPQNQAKAKELFAKVTGKEQPPQKSSRYRSTKRR